MDGRHSHGADAREHRAVERLVDELGRYQSHVDGCTWGAVEGMALRRALYRLHAMLKVHLAEEELYLRRARAQPDRRGEGPARAEPRPRVASEPL